MEVAINSGKSELFIKGASEIRETPSQPERIFGLASIYRKQGKVADAGRERRESQKLQNPKCPEVKKFGTLLYEVA